MMIIPSIKWSLIEDALGESTDWSIVTLPSVQYASPADTIVCFCICLACYRRERKLEMLHVGMNGGPGSVVRHSAVLFAPNDRPSVTIQSFYS